MQQLRFNYKQEFDNSRRNSIFLIFFIFFLKQTPQKISNLNGVWREIMQLKVIPNLRFWVCSYKERETV